MTGMMWILMHPHMTPDHLGLVPAFLSAQDERPAKEQIDANYVSGWHSMRHLDWKMSEDYELSYPGDPTLTPCAYTELRDERIWFYPSDWMVIMQPDGTWDIARLD